MGNGVNVLIKRMADISGVADEGTLARLREKYEELYTNNPLRAVSIYPGIEDMLKRAKKRGIKLAVLSNKPDTMTKFIAKELFSGIFDDVRGAKEGVPIKPDPGELLKIIDSFSVDLKEVLYCGDSGVDMQTGFNAGVDTAGVLWGFRDREELEDNKAKFIVSDSAELEHILMG